MRLYEMLAKKIKWEQEANTAYEAQAWGELQSLIALLPAGGGWNYEYFVGIDNGVMRILTDYYVATEERGGIGSIGVDIIVTPSLARGFDVSFTMSEFGRRVAEKLGLLEYFGDTWSEILSRRIVEIKTDDGWRDYQYETEADRMKRASDLLMQDSKDDDDG